MSFSFDGGLHGFALKRGAGVGQVSSVFEIFSDRGWEV